MPERLMVIGGDAAGMSAASQARRQRPSNGLEILAFERSSYVSYSACGEPYYVGGYVTDLTQLQARTSAEFAAMDITVHTCHEAVALDTQAGRVTVRNLETGKDTTLGYAWVPKLLVAKAPGSASMSWLRPCGTLCGSMSSCSSI